MIKIKSILAFTLLANFATSQTRVINGDLAKPFSYPFVVSIHAKDGHYCGGSLLDRETVLTAAHCTGDLNEIEVKAHRFDLTKSDKEENGFTTKVKTIINHQKYSESTMQNDIAIWKLENPIPEDIQVSFVKLAENQKSEDIKLNNLTAIGWGYTDVKNQVTSDKLLVAKLKVIDQKKCQKRWKKFGVVIDNTICTRFINKKQSICNGDSGGPLTYYDNKDNKFVQVGIVSFGEENCVINNNYPDGFVRVQSYLKWIKDNSNKKTVKKSTTNKQIKVLRSIGSLFYWI